MDNRFRNCFCLTTIALSLLGMLSPVFSRRDESDIAIRNVSGSSPVAFPRTQAELESALIEFGDHLIHFLGDEIDQIEAEIRRTVSSPLG